MKKNIFISLFVLFTLQVMAQEKGSYLSLSGGGGIAGIKYDMQGVNFATPKCELKYGSQFGLGYSYYFNKYIGISTGIGFAQYRTNAKLLGDFQTDKYLVLGNYTDNDFAGNVKDYELRVRTRNWVEEQTVNYIQFPLTLNLQKKFGEKEHFGLYFAAGASFQLLGSAYYALYDGVNADDSKLHISGYYKEKNLELGALGAPDVSQHGFGAIHNPGEVLNMNNQGKLNLKFNVSLIGEAGFLFSLNRRVDISLGAFMDYGLLNINNKQKESFPLFTGPETDYVSLAENNNVGKGITYNSVTSSEYVDKIRTLSYGGKAGIRIKLGKLSSRENSKTLAQEPVLREKCRDTVYIVEKQIVEKQQVSVDSIMKQVAEKVEQMSQMSKISPKDVTTPEKPTLSEQKLDFYPGVYPEEETNQLFEPVYFDLNKSSLNPESIKNLDKKVSILKKYPDIQLIIFGNTCDIGNDSYNFQLGYKRAEVARDYMLSKGISKDRLKISTMSKFEPQLPNTNEENRTHNRRDDFKPVFPQKR